MDQSHRLAGHGDRRNGRCAHRNDRRLDRTDVHVHAVGAEAPKRARSLTSKLEVQALLAAVYLHGRAGELGAAALGEKSFMATDLFEFLPEAMREISDLLHRV